MSQKSGIWRAPMPFYKGQKIWCAPGVHELCFDTVTEDVPPEAAIFDLGAGTGAFLLRLKDAGFKSLRGCDIFQHSKGPQVEMLQLDLNGSFASSIIDRFDVVIAIEVIEHLECPRCFLRQARSLLKDNGHLLLTTPNISEWRSRLQFLRSGTLRYFEEKHFKEQRHISVLPSNQVDFMLREVGFEIQMTTSGGTFLTPLAKALTFPFERLARFFLGPLAVGDVLVSWAKRAVPFTDAPGCYSNYMAQYRT